MGNLLLVANGPARELPIYLRSSVTINNVFVISDEYPSYTVKDYNHFRDCTFGVFSNENEYDLYALDAEILEALASCESITLKMMERYEGLQGLRTYDSRINLYHQQVKFWLNYLLINKIDICVITVIPHVIFDYLIYEISKYLNIKIVMFYRTTIILDKNVSLYQLSNLHEQMEFDKSLYSHYLKNPDQVNISERVLSYYDLKVLENKSTFTGVGAKNRSLTKYLRMASYYTHFKYRLRVFREWYKWVSVSDLFMGVASKFGSRSDSPAVTTEYPDTSHKFVYVALHYQPECSTSPLGGYFVHQDLMIDMLTKALPIDVRIYVKAHIRGGYSKRLLDRLRIDSRTVLLDPKLSSLKLIQDCSAVATVTGTAGWEGVLNHKPVLMFGNYFYQSAPGVFQIKTMSQLNNAANEIFGSPDWQCPSAHELNAYLQALDDLSFEGWVDNRYASMSGMSGQENCEILANKVALSMNQKE